MNQPTNTEHEADNIKRNSRTWWEEHPMDYVGYRPWRDNADPEKQREFFRTIDHEFARQAYFAHSPGRPLFSRLIDYGALTGRRVLEIGSGLGAISGELARQGARVTSVDLTATGVTAATARFRLDTCNGAAVQADAERLPFHRDTFDFVWSWGVLHHTPRTAEAILEARRVLRPGGELSIMLYNRASFYNWFNVILRYGILRLELRRMTVPELWNRYTDGKLIGGCPHVTYYTPDEMRCLLSGFKVTEMRTFDQKQLVLGLFPRAIARRIERIVPDSVFDFCFARYGFLLFCRAIKQ
jgi:SAM-dependent methyltransferase